VISIGGNHFIFCQIHCMQSPGDLLAIVQVKNL
jgi:hypothetical protein